MENKFFQPESAERITRERELLSDVFFSDNYEQFLIRNNSRSSIEKISKKENLYNSLESNKIENNHEFLPLKNEVSEIENSYLDSINTLVLESPTISERIDSFISFEINDYPIRNISHEISERTFEGLRSSVPFTFDTGLTISPSIPGYCLVVDGVQVVRPTETVGRIDFMPGGRTSLDQARMTESMVLGIRGIRRYVESVESGEVTGNDYLMGTTNINMALIAQRLGFSIIDSCREADGTIDRSKIFFIVVGKYDDVKDRVAQFVDSGTVDRLEQRNSRVSQPRWAVGQLS